MTAKERNDYFYVCALIEYIARETLNHRGDIVKAIGEEGIKKLLHDAEGFIALALSRSVIKFQNLIRIYIIRIRTTLNGHTEMENYWIKN